MLVSQLSKIFYGSCGQVKMGGEIEGMQFMISSKGPRVISITLYEVQFTYSKILQKRDISIQSSYLKTKQKNLLQLTYWIFR